MKPSPITTHHHEEKQLPFCALRSLHTLLAAITLFVICITASLFNTSSAYAAEEDLLVASSISATFEYDGSLFIPTVTLTNNTPYSMTITDASAPKELGWTCDAAGQTIAPKSSIQVTWVADSSLSSEQASEAADNLPFLVGQLTYSWTYDVPVYASVFANGALIFTQGLPSEETIAANGGSVIASMTGFEKKSYPAASKLPWYKYATRILSVSAETKVHPVSTAFWFSDLAIRTADVSNIVMSQVTNMKSMFAGSNQLQSIITTGWDTSQVTNMSQAFAECSSLSSLNVSGLNTSNVRDFSSTFLECSSLIKLNLSGWQTSNATTLYAMFKGCNQLRSISGASSWNTSNVTNMADTFLHCSLLELDCSKWAVSNVSTHSSFSSSSNVTEPNWS